MGKVVIFFLAVGGWIAYVMHGKDVLIPKTPDNPPVRQVASQSIDVNTMSESQFKAWVARQNPHDPEPAVADNIEHYSPAQLADLQATMNGSNSSSSASQALNSGNATFMGTASDSGAGSVLTSAATSTYVPGMVIPVGYHLVKAHYTKKGHYVKAHLARNRTRKSTSKVYYNPYGSTVVPSVPESSVGVSRTYDRVQRRATSQQDFPSVAGQISKTDSTIIIGNVN